MDRNIDEKEVYEVLGVEPPKDPEPDAEPEGQDQEPENQEQDPGKQDPETEQPEQLEQPEGGQEPGEDPKAKAEADAAAAEQRRRQELEQARREAAEQAKAEANEAFAKREKEFFRRAQLRNQYDADHPLIESFDQFEAWYKTHQAKRMEQQLKAGQLTPEMLEQAARRAVESQKPAEQPKPQEAPAAQTQKERFQAQVQTELQEIQKLDPKMTSIKDVLDSPMGDDFRQAVKDGATFLSAFRTAKRISEYKAKAAAAEVSRKNQNSKNHMVSHRGSGAATMDKEVPPETVELYRMLNPEMTADEIRRDYNKRRS